MGAAVLEGIWEIVFSRKITDPGPVEPRPRFDLTGAVLSAAGLFFVVSVYLQEVSHYDAIKTGLILTPGTIGILVASAGADRFARRHPQRWLIIAGFLITAVGMILLLALVRAHAGVWRWIPGLFLFGAGVGTMLTSSVNVVQSSFPGADQGEISGLSRSVSNLGSSLGTALAGSILVAVRLPEGKPFAAGLTVMLVFTLYRAGTSARYGVAAASRPVLRGFRRRTAPRGPRRPRR
jgi:MFS family permease